MRIVQERRAELDYNKASYEREMEPLPADALRPQRLRQLSGLLARLGPGRVGVVGQDGQDLGCEQRRVPADTR